MHPIGCEVLDHQLDGEPDADGGHDDAHGGDDDDGQVEEVTALAVLEAWAPQLKVAQHLALDHAWTKTTDIIYIDNKLKCC